MVAFSGHVIAARITAENPDEGFTPSGGTLQELTFRSSRDVWGYFSVCSLRHAHCLTCTDIGQLSRWPSRVC